MTQLSKATITFLKDLKSSNNKPWFDKNRKRYEEAKAEFEAFIEKMLHEISGFDPLLRGVKAKDCTFRIFKDVRFSKDKSPYKPNFGANMARGGRKQSVGGYYLHLEPGGNSFLAGGAWHPEPPVLAAIRQEIDYNTKEFKGILNEKKFKSYFGGLAEDEKLARAPKGYSPDHPEIELLKHRNYIVTHEVADKQLTSPDYFSYVTKIFKTLKPLNDFLIRAAG